MSEPAPAYAPATAVADPHLADLLELRTIAQGTEAEAYTWPRLARRLNEMIQQRQAALAARVGAPTDTAVIA